MKTLLLLPALLVSATLVRADLVIEQKLESSAMNGAMTMKIKGDHARTDIPSAIGGKISTIMDLKTGDMTTLMHAQKMAMKMNMKDARAEALKQGVDPSKIGAPKSTGKKEKVGQWDTEIFEITVAGATSKMWVAKDYPKYKEINAELLKMSSLSMGQGVDPSKFDLGGMVVKTEATTAAGKISMTLVSAALSPVADSEFVLPEGYQVMEMPKMPAAGQ